MSKQLTAIVVDDELSARENLSALLTSYCNLKILAEAKSGVQALALLATQSPDILFLDIEMPNLNGIELAHKLSQRQIPIIFVTAHDRFAIQALRASAIDYLLKPAKIEDLQAVVEKVAQRIEQKQPSFDSNHFEILSSNRKFGISNLVVPWENGFKIIDLKDLMYIYSENSYADFFLTQTKLVVSKPIGELEDLLDHSKFHRVHNRYIINLDYLDTFTNKDGGSILMKNGATIPVSRRRLKAFKEWVYSYLPQ